MSDDHIFVYGTLRKGGVREMPRLFPRCRDLGPATLRGCIHDFGAYPGLRLDEDGVVHDVREEASGEAWEHGPVILSWEDTELGGASPEPGAQPYNVVVHEFAHKLDMLNGEIGRAHV